MLQPLVTMVTVFLVVMAICLFALLLLGWFWLMEIMADHLDRRRWRRDQRLGLVPDPLAWLDTETTDAQKISSPQ